MDPIKVGQLIADSRKNLNMTQKELAEQLSITGKAVSKCERNEKFEAGTNYREYKNEGATVAP